MRCSVANASRMFACVCSVVSGGLGGGKPPMIGTRKLNSWIEIWSCPMLPCRSPLPSCAAAPPAETASKTVTAATIAMTVADRLLSLLDAYMPSPL